MESTGLPLTVMVLWRTGKSVLPGISLDVLSASLEGEDHLPAPDQYCHINLPRNPLVIDRIMQYLTSEAGKG